MADTGFVRFSTVDSSDGFDQSFQVGDSPSPSNLITPNVGAAQENRTFKQVTLSGLDLNIPAGSTIDGIEFTFRAKYISLGLNYRVSSSLFLGETQGTIHVNRPGSDPSNNALGFSFQDFTFGSSTTTEGLTGLTTSNIENLKFKLQTGAVFTATGLIVESNSESPAIKVYYTPPTDPDIKKFNTLESNTGWTLSNFVGNAVAGTATATSTGNNFTLGNPIVNDTTPSNNSTFSSTIPSNAIITGIETRYLAYKTLGEESGGAVTVDNRTNISSLDPTDGTGIRQLHVVTSSNSSSPDQVIHGGPSDLQGLSNFTLSDLDNIEWFVTTIISSNTLKLVANLSPSSYDGFISPAVKVYYNIPASPSSVRSGPRFISSTVDLTSFRGLGDKISPLQIPPSSEDLFGFTAVIVPEGDNSSQATDSTFGDAANFGKLATNRGGGTGISSNTGLLDTSKAPLSVRKGFRGL